MSRQAILSFCIAISMAFHIAIILLAPRLYLISPDSSAPVTNELIRIRLVEAPPPIPESSPHTSSQADPQDSNQRLASRPESIEDLLNNEPGPIKPMDIAPGAPAEVPMLGERLAADTIIPDFDPLQEPSTIDKMDARILEISQDNARRDLNIPRQLVRPSNSRIVPENEFPTLREEGAASETLSFPDLPVQMGYSGDLAGAANKSVQQTDSEIPGAILSAPEELPELSVEQLVTRAPVVEEVRQASNYQFLDDLVEIKVQTYTPQDEQEAYFRVQVIPKSGDKIPVLPKDITLVIDASGSILQEKLNRTVAGTREIIDRLRDDDYFNIVVFRETPSMLSPQPIPATAENRQAAKAFLLKVISSGETDVYTAIRPAVMTRPRPNTAGIVMLMSDGRSTTGVKDSRTIINALSAENAKGNSIFAFGGGKTVNHYLLDLLAYRNKGESFVTPMINDIDASIPRFFDRLKDPILMGLNANYGSVNTENVYPRELPDFFKGKAVEIYGRFDPVKDKELAMQLTGVAAAQKKEMILKANLSEAEKGDKTIAKGWAFQKIYHLIGEICRLGETPALLNQLRELSRQYGVKTSYDE